MKYTEGNIVLLHNGETVYICSVDNTSKAYYAYNVENEDETYTIFESDIYMLVT